MEEGVVVRTVATGPNEAAVRDHLANERTLLAWQRTALTVIGLGFVVDRFAVIGTEPGPPSALLGISLVVLGGEVALARAYRYLRTAREIDTRTYRPSVAIHLVLTGAIIAGAIGLVIYLLTAPAV